MLDVESGVSPIFMKMNLLRDRTSPLKEANMRSHIIFTMILCLLVVFGTACQKKNRYAGTMPETPSMAQSVPPPVETPQTEEPKGTDIDELTGQLQPVFFDFNRSHIRDDQVPALQANGNILRSNPHVNVILEGHCDERGTEEYNLALGELRAKAVKDYLVQLGIAATRIQTLSYGEDRPFAFTHNEDAWQQNRRAQSVVLKSQ
jgi:peptidoglycan-associated lipoprotein